jgi:hypothetical protein
MKVLPNGHVIRLVQHGSHAAHGHTIFIFDIWQSQADFDAGKAPVRWDATLHWNSPGQDAAKRVIEHMTEHAPRAFAPTPDGEGHLDHRIVSAISNRPDTHRYLSDETFCGFLAEVAQ